MKILFVRHGESQDDIEDRYGGWADFDLTQNGSIQLKDSAEKIIKLNVKFEVILSSPLKRALQSAEVLATELNLPVDVLEYVKERNRYGVLTGMEKTKAKVKYPEEVRKLDKGDYVDASERQEDFEERIKKSVNIIKNTGKENLIVVTHGSYLLGLFQIYADKKLTKKDDGGFILVDVSSGGFTPISSDGIEYE